jgi:signal transduction histidine kinase
LSHEEDDVVPSPTNETLAGVTPVRETQGTRTHIFLVFAMALVIAIVTGLSLLVIRHQLTKQVTGNLSQDLVHSVTAFQNLQAERLADLERENALLAKLPTLKALMTSGDDLTIQNEAAEFWHDSGADLFVLADPSGRIVAAFSQSGSVDPSLRPGLKILLSTPDKHYLIGNSSLYACALQPLYFGSDREGTVLGYLVIGTSIERTVRQMSEPTGVEAAFFNGDQIVATTLEPGLESHLAQQSGQLSGTSHAPEILKLGNTRFLSATEDLSVAATSPLRLVVLKSFKPAEESINRIDRLVLIVGFLSLLSGTALMIVVSRLMTRPLEELSRSVRAFGLGDVAHRIPVHGTREVRQLSAAFARMRSENHKANLAVVESERLATIGRMASSVSHDLRHYLAAIYANSEFLASDRFSAKERAEIFSDIRAAVSGTTDMLESLLIFSRTGTSIRRKPESMATLLESATALIRTHPDAEGVTLVAHCAQSVETTAVVDGKQIERAISNLLLNACQSARLLGAAAYVAVTLETQNGQIIINVIDNGPGVPARIRKNLFDPFVSEGKQKGTGLGLTLAHCIAEEHGGEVTLLVSHPGETIFQMKVARAISSQKMISACEPEHPEQVTPDDNL